MNARRCHDDVPVSLRDSLDELTSELQVAGPDAMQIVAAEWPRLVGSEVAPHVRMGSLRNGVLTLEVDDAVWSTPLRYLVSGIVDGLTARVGEGVVTGVRITVRHR